MGGFPFSLYSPLFPSGVPPQAWQIPHGVNRYCRRSGRIFPLVAKLSPTLHLPLSEKRRAWVSLIDGFINDDRISRASMGELIGRLSFSHTVLFWKFDRAVSPPLPVDAPPFL